MRDLINELYQEQTLSKANLINLLLHINDEAIRNSEIDKYIVKNNFNQEMARDKIAKVSKFILSNNLDKLNVKSNTVFYLN